MICNMTCNSGKSMTRRAILAGVAAASVAPLAAGQSGSPGQSGSSGPSGSPGTVPQRPLGRTGLQVSALGIGGYHLGSTKNQEEANAIVHEALDAGINFFDNCWEYHDGVAEERMGVALEGLRNRVVLMSKVCSHGRDKKIAMRMLEESLRRLRTDHLDVWQIHEVVYWNDPDLIFAADGAAEALTQAKREGKVRFVGFTGHKDPGIHLKMLSHDFAFDTVQMPLNCFDASFRSFETAVLPELNRRGIAPLGMKSMGGSGEIVQGGAVTPEQALRYAMSLPVATTISGIDSIDVLRQNIEVARNFKPFTAAELKALRDRCSEQAADGHLELFKTTTKYDGAEGRRQHQYPDVEKLPA
jgi:uncharacterized protein